MIVGTGIDIVQVERIRHAVAQGGERFLQRVFTQGEIDYCYQKRDPFLSLAARFAAKEAFIKAIPGGQPVSFADIEVRKCEEGKPLLKLHGRAEDFLKQKEALSVHLSLSHEKDYAVASVVIEAGQ